MVKPSQILHHILNLTVSPTTPQDKILEIIFLKDSSALNSQSILFHIIHGKTKSDSPPHIKFNSKSNYPTR